MNRAYQGEHTEYWVQLELEPGDREKLEEHDEIMDECESLTDTDYYSVTSDSSQDDLINLINEVLEA